MRAATFAFRARRSTSCANATKSTATLGCATARARRCARTPPKVVSKILCLRQNYHFGPRKIVDYLACFHGIAIAGSSVHRILGKHSMARLLANQKHQQTPSAGSGKRRPSLVIDCRWT